MKTALAFVTFLLFSLSGYSQTSSTESDKIATFCKLWGFLKYYHPTVAKGKLDWDQEFMTRVKVVLSLNSKQEINDYYTNWITGLGTMKRCRKCNNQIPDSLKFNLDLAWLSDSTRFTKTLTNHLLFIQENRNQGKNYYVQQERFVENASFSNEKPYKDSVFPSAELRLLSLARYWNSINYFYPYKYAIGQDWNQALVEMIPKFKDAKGTIPYHLAMLELTAKINDSHAGFVTRYTNDYFGFKWAPFGFKIIDNKAIVTTLYNDSICKMNDIQLGDVFLSVNNETIEAIINEKSKYIGASNLPTKLRNFYYAIFNGETDSVSTTFERNGVVQTKTVYRYYFQQFRSKTPAVNQQEVSKILDGNIGYVNLGILQLKDADKVLNTLKNTNAIIFDVRNYPKGTLFNIANFLNPDSRPFAKFTVPDISYPGVYHYVSPYYCGKKNKTPYTGKVILLCNETSQSHAEFTLMALQTAPNVTTIGSQTAGADGNVSLLTFPGNYQTYMSGIGVYYPDGRETQRIGIVPDIEVKPTIEGIRAGKDEVLERALEILRAE
jgi:C-terminal processing protease CtpA/Prc